MTVDPLYVFYGFAALAVVLAVEAAYLLLSDTKSYRSRVNRRLEVAGRETDREKILIQLRRERGMKADGDSTLSALRRLVVQSGVRLAPLRIGLALTVAGAAVFAGVFHFLRDPLIAAGAALVAVLVLPFAVLVYLRKRRQQKFAEQFPEAIDVIVRSLRAGHPVPVAVSMVAREMADPVGSEFGMVADEITYGSELEGALRSMMERVGGEDLPLFVTSVAIQATTGGNLSQILENLGAVIRDRFKMRRKIKGLSAEGRVSAWILNLTPFAVFVAVNLISPDFYGDIADHPFTMPTLIGCLSWMFIGNLIMRRMINFKI